DHADATLSTEGLPVRLRMRGGTRVTTTYTAMPTLRGEVRFAPADVRVRSRWGLCELLERLGTDDVRRVYPDFAQVARYAWLAGNRHQDLPAARRRHRLQAAVRVPRRRFGAPHGLAGHPETGQADRPRVPG